MILKVHPKLQHLSKTELENMMNEYYNKEKVTDLLNKYKISYSNTTLYKIFPPEKQEHQKCPYCGYYLYKNRPSRNLCRLIYARCLNCQHIDYLGCECEGCNAVFEAALKEKKDNREKDSELINEVYSRAIVEKIDYNDLTFKEKVYLKSLIRFGSNNGTEIEAFDTLPPKFAPTNRMAVHIYEMLYHGDIIRVDPSSREDAFPKDDIDFPYVFIVGKVKFFVNTDYESSNGELENEVALRRRYIDEAYELWKWIALFECKEYLEYSMYNAKFKHENNADNENILMDVLKHHSTSQIFEIIDWSIANTAKLYREKKIKESYATYIIMMHCRKYSKEVRIKKTLLINHSTQNKCKQSILSECYFNEVLRIGDCGFTEKPSREFLLENNNH